LSQFQVARESLRAQAEKTVLVHVFLPGAYVDQRDALYEIRSLAETAGAEVVGAVTQRLRNPNGKTYLGKGKLKELLAMVETVGATLVVFDNDLAPNQIRNLEETLKIKILDRSELILDIFATRATTHAAKLQVEIAQLEYTIPRLRAMWSHLGQVTGTAAVGIGTRGPGETQLETDRRLAHNRLVQLKRELGGILERTTRDVAARNRDHFTVGVVGYTNAGKSTLFNRLTRGGAFAHDMLFATLSTRVERWDLGGGNAVLLSDTVGFIRDLPHHLVASFKSTLQESVDAQLLLLVVDVSDPNAVMQLETVERTLDEIGATNAPRLIALNKVDQVAGSPALLSWLNRYPDAVAMSAATGEGVDELAARVRDAMLGGTRVVRLSLPLREGKASAFIEQRCEVLDRAFTEDEASFTVRVGRRHLEQLLAQGVPFTVDGRPAAEMVRSWWPGESSAPPARVPPHVRYAHEDAARGA